VGKQRLGGEDGREREGRAAAHGGMEQEDSHGTKMMVATRVSLGRAGSKKGLHKKLTDKEGSKVGDMKSRKKSDPGQYYAESGAGLTKSLPRGRPPARKENGSGAPHREHKGAHRREQKGNSRREKESKSKSQAPRSRKHGPRGTKRHKEKSNSRGKERSEVHQETPLEQTKASSERLPPQAPPKNTIRSGVLKAIAKTGDGSHDQNAFDMLQEPRKHNVSGDSKEKHTDSDPKRRSSLRQTVEAVKKLSQRLSGRSKSHKNPSHGKVKNKASLGKHRETRHNQKARSSENQTSQVERGKHGVGGQSRPHRANRERLKKAEPRTADEHEHEQSKRAPSRSASKRPQEKKPDVESSQVGSEASAEADDNIINGVDVSKYKMMEKAGVPSGAIYQRMVLDNVDPSLMGLKL